MALETLASGYSLLEGPRVDEQNRLYFSDLRGGGVYRRNPNGEIETLIPDRMRVGGLALNEGLGFGLIVGGQQISLWSEGTGEITDLFWEYEGKRFIGFNDLQPDDQGSIYVGAFGFDPLSDQKPAPGDFFRLDPNGTVTKVWERIEVTNGIGFSPDRRLLYHCDSPTHAVWVYDVTAERTLKDRRIFAKLPEGMPDGMAVDAEGGVVVAAVYAAKVVRFRPDGTLDWDIAVPNKVVTSLTFGGPDLSDLYIVTARDKTHEGTIYRTRVAVPGLPIPKARFH